MHFIDEGQEPLVALVASCRDREHMWVHPVTQPKSKFEDVWLRQDHANYCTSILQVNM